MLQDSNNQMKMYELYLGRLSKEYDLIWERFKIYAGVNTGLLLVLSFLLNWYHPKDFAGIIDNTELSLLIVTISVIGIVFSIFWTLINYSGKQWMDLMNNMLSDLEKKIFTDSTKGLFTRIIRDKSWFDVVNVNIALSVVFLAIWGFILIKIWITH